MVNSNLGLPEPPDNESNLTTNNDVILAGESDSDEELDQYDGYERLPMNPMEADGGSGNDDDESDAEEEVNEGASGLPSIVPIEDSLVQEVWSNPSEKDIEMDSEKVNQVKEAMSNFVLPPANIPEWANRIPEEEWKEHILKKIERN